MARGIYKRTKFIQISTEAFIAALNSFNNISNGYRVESSLILMSNALELISKAVILKLGGDIQEKQNKDRTITAERSIWYLFNKYNVINEIEHGAVQQIISLRNEASHNILPELEMDVLHYLMFTSYKLYRKLLEENFSSHKEIFKKSLLSISTEENVTYADRVEGLLKRRKKSEPQRRLLYLLERGVKYNGTDYVSQDDFEHEFKKQKNKRLINRSELGKFISKADLIKVIFIQAPKNHTINVDIAKGRHTTKEALPVITRRTDINKDYPYLLSTLSEKLGIGRNIVLKKIKQEAMKGNNKYHQEIKVGRTSSSHKYSDAAYQFLKVKLAE